MQPILRNDVGSLPIFEPAVRYWHCERESIHNYFGLACSWGVSWVDFLIFVGSEGCPGESLEGFGMTWAVLGDLESLLDGLGSLLGRLWPLLGRSWPLLGRSWPLLGCSGLVLGRSWSSLGRSWDASGRSRGVPGAILGCSSVLLADP